MSDQLVAWRDALASGGLPAPLRERWQTLRAGVVNLWEFEAVEYWYANGWAQLMGHNETGKSSLMALTTLIPWLGDTSSDKIDTLGRSGKQFLYYVRPMGESDRRDADASSYHGWLWVEYGRLSDGQPEFFTTLLHASARMGNPSPRLTWCTSQGARVRDALRLVDGRTVLAPGQIAAPGFVAHPTASEYKRTQAHRLLGGSVSQLESIGKLLKVARQPKLGAQLKVEFVTGHLRDSLPELNRAEVAELAAGWDQLDQLRADLDRANQATAQVARFERDAWRPWAAALLRLHADDVANRQTLLDMVTREERAAEEELATGRQREDALTAKQRAADEAAMTSRQQAEALRASAAYRDASARIGLVVQQEDALRAAENAVARAGEISNDAQERVGRAHTTHERDLTALDGATQLLEQRSDEVVKQARQAGVACLQPLDADLVRQLCAERRTAVAEVSVLLRDYEAAHRKAETIETIAGDRQASADAARQRAEQAWQDAKQAHEAVTAALREWTPEPARRVWLTHWLDALPRSADQLQTPALTELIRRDHYEPAHTELVGRHQQSEAAWRAASGQAEDTQRELADLEGSDTTPPDDPRLWRRRDRSGAFGAPFWQLVNPKPDLPSAELNQLEAALAASGLLDAWVTDEPGAEIDTFAVGAESVARGSRLSAVLSVADDAGGLGALLQNVLDSVALCASGAPLPATGVAVAVDGRWRNVGLVGRAAPRQGQAEWLGVAAREAQRQRRLAELRVQLETEMQAAAEQQAAMQRWSSELAELEDRFRQAPSDQPLRAALARCDANDSAASEAQANADRELARARQQRLLAEERQAALRRAANQYALKPEAGELERVGRAIVKTEHALQLWRDQLRIHKAALGAASVSGQQVEQDEADAARQLAVLAEAEVTLRLAQARLAELRAATSQADTEILARLSTIETAGEEAEAERRRLGGELGKVIERRATAEQKLDDVARRREDASADRAQAQGQLRRLLDADLAADLVSELPDPHSALVDHVRAQAAEIRRQLNPRGWQDGSTRDGQQANSARVAELRLALENKARDARAVLEQSGRSLQVVPIAHPLVSVEVVVNSNGETRQLAAAGSFLRAVCEALESQYGESVRETLDRLLGSTFLEHMRERIGQATRLIDDINQVLRNHPTGTDRTTLRIRLEPGSNAAILAAITGSGLMDPAVADQVREFLKAKVDEAKRAASDEGLADWRDSLAAHLDYRAWYEVALEHRVADGRWGPLTTRRYAELSGGARAVMLMLPLVAALAAQYQHLPGAPRPLWLDEAFDGLDQANRRTMMSLLQRFDLDVLLAGPSRLVNVEEVPAAAIYQVVRAPAPEPGADLIAELWAGNTLEAVDTPLSWLDSPGTSAPSGQDALL